MEAAAIALLQAGLGVKAVKEKRKLRKVTPTRFFFQFYFPSQSTYFHLLRVLRLLPIYFFVRFCVVAISRNTGFGGLMSTSPNG